MTLSTFSSLAFVPAIVVLAQAGSPLALVYLASLAATVAYHVSRETRWREVDQVLAWAVMGSNATLAVWTRDPLWTLAGVFWAAVAVACYRAAKEGSYDRWHALWHVFSGTACWSFARGYVG